LLVYLFLLLLGKKAKDTRYKNDVKAYQQAVEQQYDAEAEEYPATIAGSDFEGNSAPTGITYEPSVALDVYCIYSVALNDDTAGNCAGDGGDGVCDWTTDTSAFCAATYNS